MNEADYAAAIPAWCEYQTIEQHKNILLCWSLVRYAERGEQRPYSSRANCDLLNKDWRPPSG